MADYPYFFKLTQEWKDEAELFYNMASMGWYLLRLIDDDPHMHYAQPVSPMLWPAMQ